MPKLNSRDHAILTLPNLGLAMAANTSKAQEKAELEFSGGHEIDKKDFGRPIPLIAAALGVKPEEFRKAFSGVTPAKGRVPTRDEASNNKAALMKVLATLGVKNDRLDEVSNYYRFRPQNGELWQNSPAKGYALIEAGKVRSVVITEAGSGYSTPPIVSVKGKSAAQLKATLHFDKDLKKNGGVEKIEVVMD